MITVTVFGVTVVTDFTAPAWLALLSLTLPRPVLARTLAACLLHESAHFLAMALLHRRPESLRISAVGLGLRMKAGILCPTAQLVCILLAGIAANASAAGCLYILGMPEAAGTNLSLAVLNLLPFSGTDGGTLLETLLTQHLLTTAPEKINQIMRRVSLGTALLFALLLRAANISSPSLIGMLVFLTGGQICESGFSRKKSPLLRRESIEKYAGLCYNESSQIHKAQHDQKGGWHELDQQASDIP